MLGRIKYMLKVDPEWDVGGRGVGTLAERYQFLDHVGGKFPLQVFGGQLLGSAAR